MSEGVVERRWQLAIRLTVAGLVWSVGLVLAALLIGAYSGQTDSSDAGVTLTTRSFVQVNGLTALILVAIPALACMIVGAALRHRHDRRSAWSGPVAWAAVAVLAVEAILGIATFGAFLIPVAILLGLSVRLVPGPSAAPAPAAAATAATATATTAGSGSPATDG
jgi:hypothetical protein